MNKRSIFTVLFMSGLLAGSLPVVAAVAGNGVVAPAANAGAIPAQQQPAVLAAPAVVAPAVAAQAAPAEAQAEAEVEAAEKKESPRRLREYAATKTSPWKDRFWSWMLGEPLADAKKASEEVYAIGHDIELELNELLPTKKEAKSFWNNQFIPTVKWLSFGAAFVLGTTGFKSEDPINGQTIFATLLGSLGLGLHYYYMKSDVVKPPLSDAQKLAAAEAEIARLEVEKKALEDKEGQQAKEKVKVLEQQLLEERAKIEKLQPKKEATNPVAAPTRNQRRVQARRGR